MFDHKKRRRKKGRTKWCIREEGARDVDNGWRFFSEFDTEEYLAEISNWSVVDFDSIVEIDPMLLSLMWMPYGTEITIEYGNEEISYIDDHTGVPIVDPLGGKPMLIKRIHDQPLVEIPTARIAG